MEERPGTNNSTINALISVKWKVKFCESPNYYVYLIFPWEEANYVFLSNEQELGEEEKQDWNAKAAEAMEAYKKALEEYNKSVASWKSTTMKAFQILLYLK